MRVNSERLKVRCLGEINLRTLKGGSGLACKLYSWNKLFTWKKQNEEVTI